MNDCHIHVDHAGLRFRVYSTRHRSIKETVLNFVLRRTYGRPTTIVTAVDDVTLTVNSGERLGIVGDNGAGKSSLLKLIARIYPPTAGRVSSSGFLVPLLEVGIGFNGELSGLENIFLTGAIMGFSRSKMQAKIPAILDFSEMHDFIDTPVKYYSSGMAQRLAFSVATEIEPEILLLDEVFSVGDIHWIKKAERRMQTLISRSAILVLVSHQMDLIERYCNRAVWMRSGNIALDGPPAEVIAAYRDSSGNGA
jgi:ABC-type polysaccharide/polyol phosphate transport system ATPase subunit